MARFALNHVAIMAPRLTYETRYARLNVSAPGTVLWLAPDRMGLPDSAFRMDTMWTEQRGTSGFDEKKESWRYQVTRNSVVGRWRFAGRFLKPTYLAIARDPLFAQLKRDAQTAASSFRGRTVIPFTPRRNSKKAARTSSIFSLDANKTQYYWAQAELMEYRPQDENHIDFEQLRARLRKMSDEALLSSGTVWRAPLFSGVQSRRTGTQQGLIIRLEEARAEWRRREGQAGISRFRRRRLDARNGLD